MRSVRSLAVFVCAMNLLWGDQLTLKNGDRITGKVVKKEGDTVTFKTDLLGEVTLKWPDIAALTTDQPLTVELPGDRIVTGSVSAANGQITIETNTIPQQEIRAVRNAAEQAKFERFRHPPLTALWAGYLDVGMATVRGNSSATTVTTGFSATRVTRHDAIRLSFAEVYARGKVNNVLQATADAARGGWAYDRNTHPRVFVNVFNNYEYDSFQNLDLRFTAGGGLGYHAVKHEQVLLDLLGGVDYNHEKFSVPQTAGVPQKIGRDSAEAFWGDDFNFKIGGGRSSLKQTFRMFDNLTDTGQYRLAADLGIDTKVAKFLNWQVTLSDRYLSNPPIGRLKNDLLLSTGVRLTFAR